MNLTEKKEGAATWSVSAPLSNAEHSLDSSISIFQKNSNEVVKPFEESKRRAQELIREYDTVLPLPSISAPEPFPFDALGEIPGAAAKAICETVRAADSICGLSILAAMSLSAQAHSNVDIGYGVKPINLYCLSVAESGERKSAVDKIAIKVIKAWQKAEERCFLQEKEVHRRQYDLWEKKRRDALNSKDAEKLLLELPPAPIAPLQPYMICEEPSYEGLVELFNIGQPTAGIFSDDGARLVGGYAFSEDNKLKTAAGLSSIWDGSEITRVRKGDGCFTLRGKRLSVHLMLQEVALQRLVQGGVLEKQGLLARFLLIQPEQLAGKRKFVHEDPSKHPAVIAFDQMMGNLLDRRLPIDEDSPQKNELIPKTLKCGPAAQAIWVDYYHEVEFQEGTEGKYSTIRSFASKSGEQAFRIAAVLTTVEDPNAAEISVEHMKRGVILARYFLNETLRIFSGLAISQQMKNANALFEWLINHQNKQEISGGFTKRTLTQFGPNALRQPTVLQEAIKILVEHQYIDLDNNRIFLRKMIA